MLAGLVRHLRRTPDRILHPLRRRRALEALLRRPRPATLLIICHGNICRSPFAAALLGRALPGLRVESAGFLGLARSSPAGARAAAARRGVDLSSHRSRLLTAELARAAELIIVMDAAQRRAICDRFGRLPRDVILLGDLDPAPIAARAIPDPVDQPAAVFDESYACIERCAGALASALTRAPAERAA